MVVDDDPDVLEVFQLVLSGEDHKVMPLLSPRYIFKNIEDFNPDLIILDIMLNVMDGRVVFDNLRANKNTANIPVILSSARYDENYLAAQNYFPNYFLKKPFDLNLLLKKVNLLTKN